MTDRGLREALEKLCDRYDRIAEEVSIRGGVKASYDIPGSEIRYLLAAHPATPAVPQPIERAVCNACGWEGEPVHDICPACRQDTLNFFTPASGSAVQPVDRKVLEIQLADELASWTDDAPASRWKVAEALAGRVLAVLAGEQEQVEP